ncbi:MAG: DNA-binding protein [Spirochaetes bacterium]|nr:DNA-binding protein [Spirochaetota bacterium]
MNVIIDTNIIFSLLLKKNHPFLNHIILSELNFYSVNEIFIEIYKYKEKINKNTKLLDTDIIDILNKILNNIILFNSSFISIDSRKKAYDLCKDVDPKDIPFVALTIELEGKLWTGDIKLKNGLNKLGFNRFYYIKD